MIKELKDQGENVVVEQRSDMTVFERRAVPRRPRFHAIVIHEISERMGYSQQEAVTAAPYIETVQPQSTATDMVDSSSAHPAAKSSLTEAGDGVAVPPGFSLHPDPKLLEALENPKDRLFLLRLEQKVVEFVKDSK